MAVPGLLRLLVRLPRQQRRRLRGVQARLPLHIPSAPRPLRPVAPRPRRAQVHHRPAPGLPHRRAANGLTRPRVPLLRRDAQQRAGRARRPPGDDHRHDRPERRAHRRLGPLPRRRATRILDQNDARPPEPSQLERIRVLRRALPPVLRRHLVARRLRAARGEQDRARQAQTPERHGAGAALRRGGRGAIRVPDGGAALLPGRGPLRAQRLRAQPGQHLPGPERLPRLHGRRRARKRPAPDPRQHRCADT